VVHHAVSEIAPERSGAYSSERITPGRSGSRHSGIAGSRAGWEREARVHDITPGRGLRGSRAGSRKLDDLRALEAQRYAEKDRAIAELKKRAEVKEKRTLVATACWRAV
jgi:hypothetical protein